MKKAIITFGLPASGKSTYIKKNNLLDDYTLISADHIKKSMPDFDPGNPEAVHIGSVEAAENELNRISDIGVDLVMDGGGINNRYTKRLITNLKNKNYHIKLIRFDTPLHVCLHRNKLRIDRGQRFVPEDAIIAKSKKLETAWENIKNLVDEIEIVEDETNHIFIDMDGNITEIHEGLPTNKKGEIDFTMPGIFKNKKPVLPIINRILNLFYNDNNILYILSAAPNSISIKEKHEWLDEFFIWVRKENRYFANSGKHKALMLDTLIEKLGIKKENVLLIDDRIWTLEDCKRRGIKAVHPTHILTL